jgi:mono/diheme cytochrome c family protein
MNKSMASFQESPSQSRKQLLCAISLIVATSFLGCRARPTLTPEQAEGQHLYNTRCAHCHEDNDLGLKKAPPRVHGLFDQATLPSGLPATDQNVEREVLAGKGMMPSFAGRFTQEQMAALLAYLHTDMPGAKTE